MQYDMFTGQMVDIRTERQKRQEKVAAQPKPIEMFSTAEIAQFGVEAHPLLPIAEATRLGLELFDTRTDEEKVHDTQKAAETLTSPLFADQTSDVAESSATSPQPVLVLPALGSTSEPEDVDEDMVLYAAGIVYRFGFPVV